MSLQDISLPIDIPWQLMATSDDMIANHDKRFPHAMWKSSMAVFSYDPDPQKDILPEEILNSHREITYLKVVCSITSYVPPCEECPPPPAPVTTIEDYGENQANLDAWRKKCKIINDAETNGALYKGYYYWIMEPAVLLMATGLGFAMLGFALDRVFNPRLRDI